MVPVPFQSEPALARPTPRRVKVTFNSWCSRTLLYGCFLAVFALTVVIWRLFLSDSIALRDHGKTTQAVVVSKNAAKDSDGDTQWYLHYQFLASKTIQKDHESVDQKEYDATPIGHRFVLTYLPEHPRTHQIGVVTANTVISDMIALAIFFGSVDLSLVWFAAYKERKVRNHVRLLRDEIAVQALVASKRSTGGWSLQDPSRYWITCNFYAGQQATSKEFLVWFPLYDAVTTGSSLSALYLPDRPQINELYLRISDVVILP